METIILTVLITLGVCIVSYAFIGVVRLQKSFEDKTKINAFVVFDDFGLTSDRKTNKKRFDERFWF